MPDLGIKLSDDRTRALMKRLEGVYSEAYKTAIANEKTALKKFDALTDEALKDLTPEARKLKREAFAREVKRTKTMTNKMGAELANAGQTAANIIQGEMTNIYGLNYDFSTFRIQQQAGVQIDFTLYDRNQLAVLVQESQQPFTKIAYKNLGDDKAITQRLQNQFIQGIMNGESQQQLIRRIRKITGQLVPEARRVAQTERNRVQSQGRQMGFDEAEAIGVEMDKEWVARMINTRDAHKNLNGKTVAASEKFQSDLGEIAFPGDPEAIGKNTINCFCYIKPKVKSISSALAKHRAWTQGKSFEKYRNEQEQKRTAKTRKVKGVKADKIEVI